MTMFYSAAVTAHRLGISKTYLINLAKQGKITPPPTRMEGSGNPWLFAPNSSLKQAKNKTVDKAKRKG